MFSIILSHTRYAENIATGNAYSFAARKKVKFISLPTFYFSWCLDDFAIIMHGDGPHMICRREYIYLKFIYIYV